MNTIQYLTGPEAAFYWPGIISGVVLAVICSLLSPLVVLRRMAFIGQGVSHAAFGGIGVAAVLGLGGSGALQFGVVAAFCVLAALLISRLETTGAETGRQSTRSDTAIGIVLAGSMACGVLLTHAATRLDLPRSGGWEQILFGSILAIGWGELVISVVIGVGVAASLWLTHRHMTFWAFEPQTAIAFGVRGSAMRYLLVVLLAAAVVITMKLVGVVLATALLVTPAATALHLSERWEHVRWLSVGSGLLGTVGGLILSFEVELPPGACIVAVLILLYALAYSYDQFLRSAKGTHVTATVGGTNESGATSGRIESTTAGPR